MKAENVMKEEVVFVLLPLINIKAVFTENGNIKLKVLSHVLFRKQMCASEI
jgi:hypothetical protein